MGAWGHLAFDNDDACDWAYALEDATDFSLVESAIKELEDVGDDYLEAPVACNALAACEVLARCLGNPGYQNAYTKTVDDWVAKHKTKPTIALQNRARSAIARVLGDNSELQELWLEADEADTWRKSVEDLRQRIAGTPER